MVFSCGQCGAEFTGGGYPEFGEGLLMLHLKLTGHCQQEAWTHKGRTQKELQRKFEESLTREDADLLRGYGVKV